MRQMWLIYVRWPDGHRETIRCSDPDNVPARDRVWVIARLVMPRVNVHEQPTWRSAIKP